MNRAKHELLHSYYSFYIFRREIKSYLDFFLNLCFYFVYFYFVPLRVLFI